jgi:hypothetical protein
VDPKENMLDPALCQVRVGRGVFEFHVGYSMIICYADIA